MSVLVMYEDAQTCDWAKQRCGHIAALTGRSELRCTWWKMSDLNEEGVFAGAVSTAMRAEVIVMALHATEKLPLSFYLWVNAWLRHRSRAGGKLLALVGLRRRRRYETGHAQGYLRTVAQQGRLEFIMEERVLWGRVPEPHPQALYGGEVASIR